VIEPRLEVGERRWFIFSMKDRLPLDQDGWTVFVHEPDCSDAEGNLRCLTGDRLCAGTRAQFIPFDYDSTELEMGMTDIGHVVADLTGRRAASVEGLDGIDPPGGRRWVVAASTAVRQNDEPYDVFTRSFDLVMDAVVSLRNATSIGVADPTIERMQPFYMTARERGPGAIEPLQVVVVEHVFGPPRGATDKELELAQRLFVARRDRNPVELYRTASTRARLAIKHDGDYSKAVLAAAISCEILIKHTAWMLTFEASDLDPDPSPGAQKVGLGRLRPSQLIGQVLAPRLGGAWASNSDNTPIGGWRYRVAVLRNRVVHRGHQPDAIEAADAVAAMQRLETHITDRLVASATTYPKTALAQAGAHGLRRRGKFAQVDSKLTAQSHDARAWLHRYVKHVDLELDDAALE
jgi:hypothetical protein